MHKSYFNARWFSEAGLPREAVEYLRRNDLETFRESALIDAHEAAADPHPQYATDATASEIARSEARDVALAVQFLVMGS